MIGDVWFTGCRVVIKFYGAGVGFCFRVSGRGRRGFFSVRIVYVRIGIYDRSLVVFIC